VIAVMQTTDGGEFRELCAARGITVTHQRQVLFELLLSVPGHPSPEEVYLRVKQQIPSISLATVYKNIHLFLRSGIFREVSLHHGSLRLELNQRPHHHLVCTVCKSIRDIDEAELKLAAIPGQLPGGFLAERFSIDILGRCAACQQKT
jgi:Fur family transcriptional regulator, peroxide stress response regulator